MIRPHPTHHHHHRHRYGQYPVHPQHWQSFPPYGFNETCYNSTYPEDLGLSDDYCVHEDGTGTCTTWQPFAGVEFWEPDINFDTFSTAMVAMIRAFSFGAFR